MRSAYERGAGPEMVEPTPRPELIPEGRGVVAPLGRVIPRT